MSQPFNLTTILGGNRSEQFVVALPNSSLEKAASPRLTFTYTFSWRSPPQDVRGDVGLYKKLLALLGRGLPGPNPDYPWRNTW
ncbi:MAG: hypothetical protein ACFFC7_15865 [Candidatus Hermodarchaeota archaeon]